MHLLVWFKLLTLLGRSTVRMCDVVKLQHAFNMPEKNVSFTAHLSFNISLVMKSANYRCI